MLFVVGTLACSVPPDVESVVQSNATESSQTHTYTHVDSYTLTHPLLHTNPSLPTLSHMRTHLLTCSYARSHLLFTLTHMSLLLCSRLQPGGTLGNGHVRLSPGPWSLCLAPDPRDEY